MSDAGPFSGRAALWLGLAAAASLALSGALAVFGEAFGPPTSPGADGFSRSALGHAAFLELLRARGVAVTTSRHRTPARAGEAVVAFLEPQVRPRREAEDGDEDEDTPDPAAAVLAEGREAAWKLLVVLPKRAPALPASGRPGWLAKVTLLPVAHAQAVLDAIGIDGEVVRPAASARLEGELPAPTIDAPQLVRSGALTPLVGSADGMLAGELVDGDEHVLVLADPDVIATHGLGEGRNAELAVALLERLGAGERGVLVDETLHGFEVKPSITRELLRPPLVLATAQALVTLALLAWIALVRFGRPHPARGGPAGTGSAALVDHTARLLGVAGHAGSAAGAFWRAARDELARRLRPAGRGAPGEGWLEHAAAARGLEAELAEVRRRVAALAGRGPEAEHEAVRTAREIHRLREGLTHGTDRHDHRR